ncbi:hypothetical protein AVEN_20315-1 [Araneus ventricosus]|uniref:DDE-1 domain-containing protein n=1 Tax=Araneus ventricosus TaxID=182803 RepID=A0A4Y2QJI8_ARAVE|nr:hypothetical protein AVEN_20315-1 [Araneus ventricosus]
MGSKFFFVFLPPNSTCVLQPLDQGIIQNFKATYRKLLLQNMISGIDRKEQLQVSVLNAIFYIDQSWNMVSQKTIANCFRHAGFHSSPESEDLLEDDDEDLPLTELAEKLRNRGYAIPDENLYTKIDEDLATNSEASIQDIVSNVLIRMLKEAMMRMTVNMKRNQYQHQMRLKP